MCQIKQFFYILVVIFSFLILSGCSNLDVGFEKDSIFHSSQKNEKLEHSIVNVYLDKSTDVNNKYRLVINGEDTELNLYYDVITRFEINKERTTIKLLKNGTKVMDLHMTLASAKNYFLIVTIDKISQLPVIKQIDKHKIDKGTKATPIFASEEIIQQDEKKQVKELQKQKIQEKKEFIAKKNIGVKRAKQKLVVHKTAHEVQKITHKKMTLNKSLQERYDAGEAIFYYDPDDGE